MLFRIVVAVGVNMDEDIWKTIRGESISVAMKHLMDDRRIIEYNKKKIKMFINEMRIKDFSPSTIISYIHTLAGFARFLGNRKFEEVDANVMKEYVSYLVEERNNMKSAVRIKMVRLRAFYRWIYDLGRSQVPDCLRWYFRMTPRATKGNKQMSILKKIIKEEDYYYLLTQIEDLRFKALLQFLWETGARISEVLMTKIGDVYIKEHYAIVGGGKRRVPLRRSRWVAEWLSVHPKRLDLNAPLFCAIKNPEKPLSYSTVKKFLREIKKLFALEEPITPHRFRHTRATILARAGISPYAMNKLMGWTRDSKMWAVYIHLTDEEAVNEAMKKLDELEGRFIATKKKKR